MKYSFDQFLNVRSAYAPTVDAGGDRLYFIADISGAPQLWSLPLDRAEAWPEPVAVEFDRVQWAHPAPKSRRVVVGADVGGNERTQLYLLDGHGSMPRRLTEAAEAIHTFGGWHPGGRTLAFSSNERDARYFDVYTLDVETGGRRLFRGDGTYYAGPFAPDGRALVVQQVDAPSDQTLHVLDLGTGRMSALTTPDAPTRYQHPAWAADGRSIYCTTDRDRDFLAIAALDVDTGRVSRLVEAAWDVDDFAPAPDGRRIAYEVNADGYSEVWTRELTGGHATRAALPAGQVQDGLRWTPTFSWRPDSSGYALTLSAPTSQAEIFVVDAADGAARQVTRSWTAGLARADLAEPELVRYPTFDGRLIPAFVFRPPGSAIGRSRPTVFFVHGGPESQLRTAFNPVIQYFAHRGFVVIAPNVRGSSGYGKAYGHLDDVELRMDSVRDLAAGADWAGQSGLADPRRIAVMGGSYGGFMVLAALTAHPERWAAGVDIVGIANFVTFLEQTGPWRRHLREAEYGSLARDRALLEQISPLNKVDRIVAPLMVIHGANDPRVPVGEAEQIVASLRERGRPVEYLRFEDEGHGLTKLRNRLLAFPRIADFLERHLRGT